MRWIVESLPPASIAIMTISSACFPSANSRLCSSRNSTSSASSAASIFSRSSLNSFAASGSTSASLNVFPDELYTARNSVSPCHLSQSATQ